MPDAVIVSSARSPIGRAHKGSLVGVRPDDLASQVARAALDAVPRLAGDELEDLILGCGHPREEQGGNLARIVAVELGYDTLPGTSVNRFCSSSMQAIRMAYHAIRASEGDAFLAVGVESVSRVRPVSMTDAAAYQHPMFADAIARTARRSISNLPWSDPRDHGGLPDIYIAMGQTAENVADRWKVTRPDMDEFALRSHQRAVAALDFGFWAEEITPIRAGTGGQVAQDDGPRRGTTLEALSNLKPVFRPDGRVTAGNSCPLNDGAAAAVIVSDVKAAELGLEPVARIASTAVTGISPEIMGIGPVEAIRQALARAGMTMNDIDLFEINEAFAAQVLASARVLNLDMDKLNVHGGAIAIGHPFGMTGIRLVHTLIHGLTALDKHLGVAALCVGGGQGMAIVVERLS